MTVGSKVDSLLVGGADVSGDNQVPIRKEIVEIPATPVISNGVAYLAGDAIGGVMEFANAAKAAGGTGVVVKVLVTDEDGQNAPIDWIFFVSAPAAPPANNDPYGLTDADLALTDGFVDVAATDYAAFANNSLACKAAGQRMPFHFDLAAGETSLRAQGRIGAAATYGATNSLIVTLCIEQHT